MILAHNLVGFGSPSSRHSRLGDERRRLGPDPRFPQNAGAQGRHRRRKKRLKDQFANLADELGYDGNCQVEVRFDAFEYELLWQLQSDELVDRALMPQTTLGPTPPPATSLPSTGPSKPNFSRPENLRSMKPPSTIRTPVVAPSRKADCGLTSTRSPALVTSTGTPGAEPAACWKCSATIRSPTPSPTKAPSTPTATEFTTPSPPGSACATAAASPTPDASSPTSPPKSRCPYCSSSSASTRLKSKPGRPRRRPPAANLDLEDYLVEVIKRLPHDATPEQAAALTPARIAAERWTMAAAEEVA